ncbi:unnamed protein product [Coffea canephora]|uniref:NET domain-containing protein n=1 Tax=Coffea canephora TaxID=49390 RepID=A0A068V800_COFCA|nr:unnamed protein product [Coffea canephora]
MSETSRGLGAPAENNMLGPDFFAFYMRELADLVSEEENFLAFFPESLDLVRNTPGVAGENSLTENRLDGYNFKQSSKPTDSAPLFSDAIGSQLSDFRKERLKSLARRSLLTFTKEVDEMLIPILRICRTQSLLRYKESILSLPDTSNVANEEFNPQKKQEVSASSLIDDDLRRLLEHDSTKVEEVMKRHADELFKTIGYMEQKLEEFLDLLMSNCRLMTLTEKQELRKLIQNLPPRNMERIVEIIRRSRPSAKCLRDEIHVDLEEESKETLWRLYYYVEAVANARKLCEAQ